MEPRLKSSKKWTSFPKEYIDQIRSVFQENFSKHLEADHLELKVEGRIYTQEVLLRVGLHKPGNLAYTNFEVSMDYSTEAQDAVERIHNCIDAAASMMLEYFENDGEVDFPYSWKPFPFQKQTIYLQYSTENPDLEAEADRLLGVNHDELVHEDGEEEPEDALSRAEVDEELSGGQEMAKDVFGTEEGGAEESGDDTDEGDDKGEDAGPRMFGGGKKGKKSKRQLH